MMKPRGITEDSNDLAIPVKNILESERHDVFGSQAMVDSH
jgi:hypothetical protein